MRLYSIGDADVWLAYEETVERLNTLRQGIKGHEDFAYFSIALADSIGPGGIEEDTLEELLYDMADILEDYDGFLERNLPGQDAQETFSWKMLGDLCFEAARRAEWEVVE